MGTHLRITLDFLQITSIHHAVYTQVHMMSSCVEYNRSRSVELRSVLVKVRKKKCFIAGFMSDMAPQQFKD